MAIPARLTLASQAAPSARSMDGMIHARYNWGPKLSSSVHRARILRAHAGTACAPLLSDKILPSKDSLALALLNCFLPFLLLEINRDFLFPLPLLGMPRRAQRRAEHEMCLRIVRVDLDRFAQRRNRRFRMVYCNLRLAQTKPSFAITRI